MVQGSGNTALDWDLEKGKGMDTKETDQKRTRRESVGKKGRSQGPCWARERQDQRHCAGGTAQPASQGAPEDLHRMIMDAQKSREHEHGAEAREKYIFP